MFDPSTTIISCSRLTPMLEVCDRSALFLVLGSWRPAPTPSTGGGGGGGGAGFLPFLGEPPHHAEVLDFPLAEISEKIALAIDNIDELRKEELEDASLATSAAIAVVVDGAELEKKVAADLAVFAKRQKRKKRRR